ncbi:MAG: DUF159 family protein [Oceanospirillaceae bacterium]|nr:DUF159 family protein [Oceanospirillaceae bacterium]|tara:strand:- start:929 stop:1690 length:762 start_codon:yes stop_codon:yes gene_type:complete
MTIRPNKFEPSTASYGTTKSKLHLSKSYLIKNSERHLVRKDNIDYLYYAPKIKKIRIFFEGASMCGRIEVKKDLIDSLVFKTLHVHFDAIHNLDLRPSQQASCLTFSHDHLAQVNASWGIQPEWSKHPIINSQAETVTVKKTFSAVYALHRCVVPCSGWFEWTGNKENKTKYRFGHSSNQVLFMAGIMFPDHQRDCSFVTLTTQADEQCARYHHRMPLFIDPLKVSDWLSLPQMDQTPYMSSIKLPFTISEPA